ncbi:ArnT family glycosyltransferase [Candidatus Magnetominusculus xianensis]|uniref:4-amino-4-deoxy-L-arabinose transferase n=1 Tax=Candidatus Magnetominusculus xianensis TaxID=1748249 RepID=A0ABR5SFA3_9BACT|nr:glycosyltransferase family 39 protein [Candidatus Magnetominusculus xianensis]KWT84059.1 4-amino-4-deoxy-L-arabinose transferase [Candidatus Magnetominusculus xianensis]MBF0402352.1 glycosyltransferase family 39 protein [Nitrospirota bacterium]
MYVPLICFIFTFLIFYKGLYKNASYLCSRKSFTAASVVWGFLLVISTEVLSLLRALSYWPILTFWGIAAVAACLIYCVLIVKSKPIVFKTPLPLSRFELILLSYIAFIFVATAVISFSSAPNNWDSMTYHLSRVMHWIQNRGVAHYPTNVTFQLYINPGAEFALVHFIILGGGDQFVNFIQWLSMAGSVIGVSLIAGRLGADRRGQIIAAALTASIPMGILQSTSTQNDYASAFWLVCFVYYALVLMNTPTKTTAIFAGIALGIAVLVKSTAYLYAFPVFLWCASLLIKKSRLKALLYVLVMLIFALVLNIGHYARNLSLYGHPIAPEVYRDKTTIRGTLPLPLLISNAVKNAALHMGTPSEGINKTIVRAFHCAHELMRVDISDIRATSHRLPFDIQFTFHEDSAGNFIHFGLIIICAAVFFIQRESAPDMAFYAVSLSVGFILMCLFIKWQPWNSRYHLALFVLWVPFVAAMLSCAVNRTIINALIALVLLLSVPWVFLNNRRPLIGNTSIFATDRTSQYFISRPELKGPYTGAAEIIQSRGCTNIGLSLPNDDTWEYPLWVLLNEPKAKARIEHVNVRNASAIYAVTYPFNNFVPCAVISLRPEEREGFKLRNIDYTMEWESGPVMVLFKLY